MNQTMNPELFAKLLLQTIDLTMLSISLYFLGKTLLYYTKNGKGTQLTNRNIEPHFILCR